VGDEGRNHVPAAFATRTALSLMWSLLALSGSLAAGFDARVALVLAVGAWMVGWALDPIRPLDDLTRNGAPTFGSSAGPPERSSAGAPASGGAAHFADAGAVEEAEKPRAPEEPDTTVTEEDIDLLTRDDPEEEEEDADEPPSEFVPRRLVDICLEPDLRPVDARH
jgi:hypothetical protein